MKDQQLVHDELDNRECISPERGSRQFETAEPDTDGCISEAANMLPDPRQRRWTAESILKSTQSSQSLDVAITVEVCDADAEDVDAGRPYRACHMNIPPVTISSHTSSPDDDPADQKYVIAVMSSPNGDQSSHFTSVFSSPTAQSRLNYDSGNENNPNFLSVSRTGTFSSGGSTRICSRRQSQHHSVIEPQDIISVDIPTTSLSAYCGHFVIFRSRRCR